MNNYYIVKMNGSYMNSFEHFTQAAALRDLLARRFPAAIVEIVAVY